MKTVNIKGQSLKEVKKHIWEFKEKCMQVPARIYATEYILDGLRQEQEKWNSISQLRNITMLPGIVRYALANSDIHVGYGMPIGGVGAFDLKKGVIVMGGIGYDINCGVRTMTTPLFLNDIENKKKEIAEDLYKTVPAGLGVNGKLKLTLKEIDDLLINGAEFALKKGYGIKEDLEFIEENGKIKNANPSAVSIRAKQRQINQLGTLGSGNHYLEVQYVKEVYDKESAEAYGIEKNQILISFHCGSRALGHQIGMDYTKKLAETVRKYKIKIPDKELVCAPIDSEEGKEYLSAVNAGMNCAFANRQTIAHLIRKSISKSMNIPEKEIKTLYEVGHNTAKIEEHEINGKKVNILVHRKGATRAFGPNRKEVPEKYRKIGQPVLIGGTMGTCSYILKGTEKAMQETFGSACHGAGRILSRHSAAKKVNIQTLNQFLERKGIVVLGHDKKGLLEEAPEAYKDVDEVIEIMHKTGIAKKVAKLLPIIVVKG